MTSTPSISSLSESATDKGTAHQQVEATPRTLLRWRPLPAPVTEAASAAALLETHDSPVPCRRCQHDSRAGDAMLLLSYDPFLGSSPYRGASPIYLHPRCQSVGAEDVGQLLLDRQRARLLSVRAFDGRHMMVDADVVDGGVLLETCGRMLALGKPAEYCYVHKTMHGCFAVRVERGGRAD
ncbi:Uu.00g022050.m01.CDS01 [Anthostomella pinea]|uniref:Uu.00g022050.m01.CDS01 n=1 Tax=Anthostomella pinea TaxID=933095 RepID=A0AAI8VZT1_9PEZI|nr:Uu.00g022050.m01.CDS01 [Anthostomella pinea]